MEDNNILITTYFTAPKKKKSNTVTVVNNQDVNLNLQEQCIRSETPDKNKIHPTIRNQNKATVEKVELAQDSSLVKNTSLMATRKRKATISDDVTEPLPQEQVANLQIDENNPTFKHFSPLKVEIDLAQESCDLDKSLLSTNNTSTVNSLKITSDLAEMATLRRTTRLQSKRAISSQMDAVNFIGTNHLPRNGSHEIQPINKKSNASRHMPFKQQTITFSAIDTLTKSLRSRKDRQHIGDENMQPNYDNVAYNKANDNSVNGSVTPATELISKPNPCKLASSYQGNATATTVIERSVLQNECKTASGQLIEELAAPPIILNTGDHCNKEIQTMEIGKEKIDTTPKDKLCSKDVKLAPIFLRTRKKDKNNDVTIQKQTSNNSVSQPIQNTVVANDKIPGSNIPESHTAKKVVTNAFERLISSSKEIGNCKRNTIENIENTVISTSITSFPTVSHVRQQEKDNWLWHLPKVDIENLFVNIKTPTVTKDETCNGLSLKTLSSSLTFPDYVSERIKNLKPRKQEALTHPVTPVNKSCLIPALHKIKEAFPDINIDKLFSMYMRKKSVNQTGNVNNPDTQVLQYKNKGNLSPSKISAKTIKRTSLVVDSHPMTKRSKANPTTSSQRKIADFPITKSFGLQHCVSLKEESNMKPIPDRNVGKSGEKIVDEMVSSNKMLVSNTTENSSRKDKKKHNNGTQTKIFQLFLKQPLQKTTSLSQSLSEPKIDASAKSTVNPSTYTSNGDSHINRSPEIIATNPILQVADSNDLREVSRSANDRAMMLNAVTVNLTDEGEGNSRTSKEVIECITVDLENRDIKADSGKDGETESMDANVDKLPKPGNTNNNGKAQNKPFAGPVADTLWTEKYRPRNHSEMIGNKKVVNKFYKWLKIWKIKLNDFNVKSEKHGNYSKKQPSRAWDSEEDDDFQTESLRQHIDEISYNYNTMLLSGPSGSGKTATVYACAEQLGMQVIEVNASFKRSGKLIMSQLREATQSHQVNFTPNLNDKVDSKSDPKNLKSNPVVGKKVSKKDSSSNLITSKPKTPSSELKKLSMTVILFEEVDLLFDIDEGFWSAVNSLMENTKVPIVLTCSDTALLHNLKLPYGHLIYNAPSNNLVAVNMQVMCLVEGAVTDKKDIITIYRECKFDIRRTLLALQFWIEHPLLDYKTDMMDNDKNSKVKSTDCHSLETLDSNVNNPIDSTNTTVDPASFPHTFPKNIDNLIECHLGLAEFRKFFNHFLDNWNNTNEISSQGCSTCYTTTCIQSRNLHLSYCNCLPFIAAYSTTALCADLDAINENKSTDADISDLPVTREESSTHSSLPSKDFERKSLAIMTDFLVNNSFMDSGLLTSSTCKDFDEEMNDINNSIRDSLESSFEINEGDVLDLYNAQVNYEIREAIESTSIEACSINLKTAFEDSYRKGITIVRM
ncbi:uncharacterized protein TRIADDRAFT_53629 [Trichoplax adhaerens]|uniref:AAA+ ATPase domain-containing protein n=1 Tax=Trichoplax adhaerens TaxID=10228 RepID=B3RPQ8_TRIAD|nr:predicted protein [Trichoplax adhaerens]EDV28227.1 predicted protein [Trichoplax adhaerens]|eukprot:XP_002110061.1 predicted protein [Trichoplax adhaerens]